MAIYHLSAQIIGRSAGRSSVAAAAYRAGERIRDERTGQVYDYGKRKDVEAQIYTPGGAPEWMKDRTRLWNAVEESEKRNDAQLSREMNLALPKELDADRQRELVRSFVKEEFTKRGMVADVAIHRNDPENPHAHVMLSMREVTPEGFGPKNREWNRKELLEEWRETWAAHANRELERAGLKERIDHRTLAAQGIEREPTRHLGPAAAAMERKRIPTERGELARAAQDYQGAVIDFEKAKRELEQARAARAPGADRPHASRHPAPATDPERQARMMELGHERALVRLEQQREFWEGRLAHASRAGLTAHEHYARASIERTAEEARRRTAALERLREPWNRTPEDRLIHRVKFERWEIGEAHTVAELERERGHRIGYPEALVEREEAKATFEKARAVESNWRSEVGRLASFERAERDLTAAHARAERALREQATRTEQLRKVPKWVPVLGKDGEAARQEYARLWHEREAIRRDYAHLGGRFGNPHPHELRGVIQGRKEEAAKALEQARKALPPAQERFETWNRAVRAMERVGEERLERGDATLRLRHLQRLESGRMDPQGSRGVQALEAYNGGALSRQDWERIMSLPLNKRLGELAPAVVARNQSEELREYQLLRQRGGPVDHEKEGVLRVNRRDSLEELNPLKFDRVLDQGRGHHRVRRRVRVAENETGHPITRGGMNAAGGFLRSITSEFNGGGRDDF